MRVRRRGPQMWRPGRTLPEVQEAPLAEVWAAARAASMARRRRLGRRQLTEVVAVARRGQLVPTGTARWGVWAEVRRGLAQGPEAVWGPLAGQPVECSRA